MSVGKERAPPRPPSLLRKQTLVAEGAYGTPVLSAAAPRGPWNNRHWEKEQMKKQLVLAVATCLALAWWAIHLVRESSNSDKMMGTITAVGPGGKTLTLQGDDGLEKTFRLSPNTSISPMIRIYFENGVIPPPKPSTTDDLIVGWAAQVTGYHQDAHAILLCPTMQDLKWHVLGFDYDPKHTPGPYHPPSGPYGIDH